MYGIVYRTAGGPKCPKRSMRIYGEFFPSLWRARLAARRIVRDSQCIEWSRTVNLETGYFIDECTADFGCGNALDPVPVKLLNAIDKVFDAHQKALPNPLRALFG